MLINRLILELKSNSINGGTAFSIRDRSNIIIEKKTFTDSIELLTFDLKFPNTLLIDLYIDQSNLSMIELSGLKLAGLALTDRILDQICYFKPQASDNGIITQRWNTSGLVSIDFFAADWVQYHLLYGNKIQCGNKISGNNQ